MFVEAITERGHPCRKLPSLVLTLQSAFSNCMGPATTDCRVSQEVFWGQLLAFVAERPRRVVAMEVCATADGWGREFEKMGHDVRLIPPIYVKPFVQRQKNDAADAEALVEAALRPTMRFVAVKTEDQQARAMLFRTRQMFVGQRTQMINALRGHLAEHGLVAAKGTAQLKRLAHAIEDSDTALPEGVRDLGSGPTNLLAGLRFH